MPRSTISQVELPGSVASATAFVWTPMNAVDGGQFIATGKNLIIARNVGLTSATFTLESVADPFGRTGNLVRSIDAGAYAVIGPLGLIGWCQSNGYVYVSSTSANIEVVVFL